MNKVHVKRHARNLGSPSAGKKGALTFSIEKIQSDIDYLNDGELKALADKYLHGWAESDSPVTRDNRMDVALDLVNVAERSLDVRMDITAALIKNFNRR